MNKKTVAVAKSIGLYLAMNAFLFGGAYLLRLLFRSPPGHWLEIDKPTKAYVQGTPFVIQIFPLTIAIYYYRHLVKRGKQ